MLEDLHSRLAGVVIECLDWSDLIRRYDGPGTLFYCDPTYWGCETDYGKAMFDRASFARMEDQLGHIQGRFILSINDIPEIRDIFAAFHLEAVTPTYGIATRSGEATNRPELLISNWPLGVRDALKA